MDITMVAMLNQKQEPPQTVRETIEWLLKLGRPPLPECPIEAAKQGKQPKQPCFLDGTYLRTVNWKTWQDTMPSPEIIEAWFRNPKTGIGTLGGYNGKYWLGWVDFDVKDFASQEECDRAVANWLKLYPVLAQAPRFRTPSGGYRFLVAWETEPEEFKANSKFTLEPEGAVMGELLTKNGAHTLLPPTVSINGSYHWEFWTEYPPIVSTPEEVGLYPAKVRSKVYSGSSQQKLPNKRDWTDIDWARSYLAAVPNNDLHYDDWLKVGMALQSVDDSLLSDWEAWSRQSGKYQEGECERKWRSFTPNEGVGIGTLAVMAKSNGWISSSRPTDTSQDQANRQQQPKVDTSLKLGTNNLEQEVRKLLSRDLTPSQLKAECITLSDSTQRSLRDIESLADSIRLELDLEENHSDHAEEVTNLCEISARRLTLSRYLPPSIADPLTRLAGWMGVDAESLLLVLIPTSASLLSPQTRVIVKECLDFKEPLNFYTGLVIPSGGKKSPILKVITKPLRKLQDLEDQRYKQARIEYEQALRKRKDSNEEPPIPPPPPREYFVDNVTGEALDRIKAAQPNHGLLLCKDELSGLFGSFNQYRQGRGSDREGILSGWNGSGVKVNRASGGRLSLSHDATSIVGGIQPEKLRQLMGDHQDVQGEWARFLLYMPEMKTHRLPESDTRFELGDLLEATYQALNKLAPQEYRFAADAQRTYEAWYYKLDQQRVAEPRSGISAAIAKMQGYTARLASWLHIMWEVANNHATNSESLDFDQQGRPLTISSVIPKARVDAAIQLARFFLGQVMLIYSEAAAANGQLSDVFNQMIRLSRRKGWLKAKDCKNFCRALKKEPSDVIRSYFRDLKAMGQGVTRSSDKNLEWHYNKDIATASTIYQAAQNLCEKDYSAVDKPVYEESTVYHLPKIRQATVDKVDMVDAPSSTSETVTQQSTQPDRETVDTVDRSREGKFKSWQLKPGDQVIVNVSWSIHHGKQGIVQLVKEEQGMILVDVWLPGETRSWEAQLSWLRPVEAAA